MNDRPPTDKSLRDLIDIIHFTESVAAKIHGVLDEAEVYGIINEQFLQSERYSASILLLTADRSKLGIAQASVAANKLKEAEKVAGLRFGGYRIDPRRSNIYRQVIEEGTTLQVNSNDVIGELLAQPLARLVSSVMGFGQDRRTIVTPLTRHGQIIGALAVSSTELAEYFIPSVRNLAQHIANALELADEYAERMRAEEALQQSVEKLQAMLDGTVQALSAVTEGRDPYTAGHQRRVADLASAIAEEMGLSEERIRGLHIAGLIHDMGKIQVPTEILAKPSELNELEWSFVKAHPQAGYDILKSIEFPWPVCQIVLQHHERADGSGYPEGLLGEDIVLGAAILAVADVVEAMVSHKPFRPAHGIDVALKEIQQNRGMLYHPEAVDACLYLLAEKGFEL